MATNNIDTSKLVSVGCGGTAVNSDMTGGVIRLLEEYIGGQRTAAMDDFSASCK
jgi:hypothetical protein